jgi:hypothetical protein
LEEFGDESVSLCKELILFDLASDVEGPAHEAEYEIHEGLLQALVDDHGNGGLLGNSWRETAHWVQVNLK